MSAAKSVFFQIGTNTGNDLFRSKVQQRKPDVVILVEPNQHLMNEIAKNYEGIPNVHIYNNAVYYNNDETVELYIPAQNGVYGTRAENNFVYTHPHFSLIPMNDWGTKHDMVKISAKSITFDEICRQHGITEIEYLQIDTEGFDSEIIKMIDLSKYRIRCIRFEKWTFTSDKFTRYHSDKANELGLNGLTVVVDKLKSHNYSMSEIADSDGHDILAVLGPLPTPLLGK